MFIYRSYPLKLLVNWTLKFIVLFLAIDAVPIVLHKYFDYDFILIPWLPVALIGTALAFYLGFKTNASYERLWEARKIWGSIVNESRTLAVMTSTYLTPDAGELKKRMIRRHIGWLTALRFQLRERRVWEHNNLRDDPKYREAIAVEEFDTEMKENLKPYLSDADLEIATTVNNAATHLMHLQMKDLEEAHGKGQIDNFRHVEIGNVIRALLADQGKCERIKNFPFPRQYASLNFYYVWMFIILLPFGMIGEFEELGENYVWLSIPFCTIVSWVFYTMEMIGDYSENPFEGSFNDVPITALSRTIEIDLLEIIGEKDVPAGRADRNGVLF